MRSNCFVYICVSLEGGLEEQGSGYLLAPQLVLTARHVVRTSGKDPALELVVRTEQGDEFRGTRGDLEAMFVFAEDDDLDVALIQLPRPLLGTETSFSRLARSADIPIGALWGTRGFPDAYEGARAPVQGSAHRCTLDDGHLYLDVGDAPDSGWSGLSGAPVFVADSIVGVIVTEDRVVRGAKIGAFPAHRIWADASLGKALSELEPDEQGFIRKAIEQRLHRLTKQELHSLAEELEEVITEVSVPEVLDALLSERLAPVDCMAALNFWSRSHPQAAAELTQLVLPGMVHWEPLVQQAAAQQGDVISLPIEHVAMADVTLAKLHGGECELTLIDRGAWMICGKSMIPVPGAEVGFDLNSNQLNHDIGQALMQKTGADLCQPFHKLVVRAVAGSEASSAENERMVRAKIENQAQLFLRSVERRKRDPNRSLMPRPFYIVLASLGEYVEKLDHVAQDLKREWGDALTVIRTDIRSKAGIEQARVMLHAQEILLGTPQAQPTTHDSDPRS